MELDQAEEVYLHAKEQIALWERHPESQRARDAVEHWKGGLESVRWVEPGSGGSPMVTTHYLSPSPHPQGTAESDR